MTKRMLFVALATVLLLGGCGQSSTNEESPSLLVDSAAATSSADEPEGDASASERPDPEPTLAKPISGDQSASVFDEDGDGFMTKSELRAALEARLPEFQFPSGYAFSIQNVFDLYTAPHPDETTFEAGAEYTLIGGAHMCAWGNEWLKANARGDMLTMDTAMNQLITVTLQIPTNKYIAPQL